MLFYWISSKMVPVWENGRWNTTIWIELIGSWVADSDFDAVMKAFESVGADLWK